MELLTAAIFVWWILGGVSVLLWPQWIESATRGFQRLFYRNQESSWFNFWLSERGRIVNKLLSAVSILAGLVALIILYAL
jgi:hypothetical protein